jgi:Ni/Co efflux regulator RcnB
MRKLSLFILAAGIAIVPAAASAQRGPHSGPRPGAGWRGGGMVGAPAHGPNVIVRTPGPVMHGQQMRMRHWNWNRNMHPGRNFRHGRLNRGFVINPFWFGPQFHVNNWQAYGFGAPGPDQRWVRYYDDAYLIDHDGRVLDTRYGMDWNEYGEEWGDDDGIPAYRGRHHDADDEGDEEEWAEGREGHRGHGQLYGHGGGYEPGPMPGPGYGYGYGGGYGYGFYAYPIVIETITTSGGGYSEEVVEEYVEVRHRARSHRRPRCVCAPPRRPPVRRPRPPAGERG